jgi:hypothetical protein
MLVVAVEVHRTREPAAVDLVAVAMVVIQLLVALEAEILVVAVVAVVGKTIPVAKVALV